VLTVLCLGAAVGVLLLLPESSPRLPGAVASLRPSVHVPPAQRRAFVVVLPCLIATWALGGLYASLGPSLVADVFGVPNHIVGGLLIMALNGTGIVGSLAVRGLPPRTALLSGSLAFAVGVGGTVTAVATGSLALLFVAAVVTGLGFGGSFLGAIMLITDGVAPGNRAGLLAATFVVGYLAFSLPAIAAGIAVSSLGLGRTATIYGCVVIVLALVAVAGLLVQRRRSSAAGADEEPATAGALAA
jgi:hypothetical protein